MSVQKNAGPPTNIVGHLYSNHVICLTADYHPDPNHYQTKTVAYLNCCSKLKIKKKHFSQSRYYIINSTGLTYNFMRAFSCY